MPGMITATRMPVNQFPQFLPGLMLRAEISQ